MQENQSEKPEAKVIYGDITNRMFAFSLDLALMYFPLTIISHMALTLYYPVANQFAYTRHKALEKFPELATDFMGLLNFMVQNYPQDMVIIVRQMVFTCVIQASILGLYMIIFNYRFGATPGKAVLGLKIVDKITGGRLSLSQVVIRYIGCIIVGFEVIFAGMRRDKRTWHDFMADTVVVYAPNRWYKRHADALKLRVRRFFNLP